MTRDEINKGVEQQRGTFGKTFIRITKENVQELNAMFNFDFSIGHSVDISNRLPVYHPEAFDMKEVSIEELREQRQNKPKIREFKGGSKRDDDSDKPLELKEDVKPKQYLKQFPSGAVRSDSRGKLRVDFISPYALQLIAKHFSKNSDDFNGEEEFGVNYFQGIRPIDINQSLSRHWLDVQTALIEKDISTVKEELTALAANCIMALHQIVLEEKGLYKEEFEGISYIEK